MTNAGTLVKICAVSDVSEDSPVRAEIDGFAYAIFQAGEQYYVTADQCTHGPGQLSEGFVIGCEIECPFHQGRFDMRTGAPTAPPCEIPIKVWTPVICDGAIFIDVDTPVVI